MATWYAMLYWCPSDAWLFMEAGGGEADLGKRNGGGTGREGGKSKLLSGCKYEQSKKYQLNKLFQNTILPLKALQ